MLLNGNALGRYELVGMRFFQVCSHGIHKKGVMLKKYIYPGIECFMNINSFISYHSTLGHVIFILNKTITAKA